MEHPVLHFSLPTADLVIPEREVLRYLGYRLQNITEADRALARAQIRSVRSVLTLRACYGRYEIALSSDGEITLPYGLVRSRDLACNLAGCRMVYMLAATIGIGFDRLLHQSALRSMADAAVLQAVGSAAVESFVDLLNEELKAQASEDGLSLRPRYSPGFGDFGLENQRGFFRVLDPAKNIGLSLKENCIMAPEKSVTALIGIYEE